MRRMLYKYTTLETLALILKSKSIRLNPLTVMDDLQEAQSSDESKLNEMIPKMRVTDDVKLIVPLEECLNDKYFVVNYMYDKCLEEVEYTDDSEKLSPKVFDLESDKFEMYTAKLGKYKNTYWEFQNEKRYVLRFIPVDVKLFGNDHVNPTKVLENAFNRNEPFLDFYDLCLTDDALTSMELTLAPQFTEGNRILLNALLKQNNMEISVKESSLTGYVRL